MIYLNDLKSNNQKYFKYYKSIFNKVLFSGKYILSTEVKKFEQNFKKYIKSNYCISCGNGSNAISLALRALNVDENQKIILAPNCGFYSTNEILSLGAKPIYSDINSNFFGPSLKDVQNAYQKNKNITTVIITHLYGYVNPHIELISNFCKKNKLFLIEDCAQSLGSNFGKKKVGTFGDIGIFSFYPTKNLGAFGDAGALVCKDKIISNRIIQLRQYGWKKKYIVHRPQGMNSRMDEIQAAILNFKIKKLDKENKKLGDLFLKLHKKIENKYIQIQNNLESTHRHIPHLFVILIKKNRGKFLKYLDKNQIQSDIHYPVLDYNQPIMKNFKQRKLVQYEKL